MRNIKGTKYQEDTLRSLIKWNQDTPKGKKRSQEKEKPILGCKIKMFATIITTNMCLSICLNLTLQRMGHTYMRRKRPPL